MTSRSRSATVLVALLAAGLFIVWYWATILSVGAAEAGSNGIVRWVDGLSASATQFVDDNTRIVIAALVGVIGLAGLAVAARRLLAPRPPAEDETPPALTGAHH